MLKIKLVCYRSFFKKTKIKKIKKVNYLICDISDRKKLKKIKTNYDYVVNLAGYVDHSHKLKL